MADYNVLKGWDFGAITHAYSARDTMLYALGIGFGHDPLDRDQLRFLLEDGLQVVPSMAAVLGGPGSWWRDPRVGVDWPQVLHAQQDVEVYTPLEPAATVIGLNRVTALCDRGPERGAVAALERDIRDAATGKLLARAKRIEILRGDGGFSSRGGISDAEPERLPPMTCTERKPDVAVELPSLPQAALIYRLSGDYNPLHADPQVAARAGFPRPILHGLASFGIAAHAVLRGICGYAPERLRRLAVRFTAPVYPGESLRFELWLENDQRVRFRAHVKERGITVLDRGIAELSLTHARQDGTKPIYRSA